MTKTVPGILKKYASEVLQLSNSSAEEDVISKAPQHIRRPSFLEKALQLPPLRRAYQIVLLAYTLNTRKQDLSQPSVRSSIVCHPLLGIWRVGLLLHDHLQDYHHGKPRNDAQTSTPIRVDPFQNEVHGVVASWKTTLRSVQQLVNGCHQFDLPALRIIRDVVPDGVLKTHRSTILTLECTRDSPILASASTDATMRIRNLRIGEFIHMLRGHRDGVV